MRFGSLEGRTSSSVASVTNRCLAEMRRVHAACVRSRLPCIFHANPAVHRAQRSIQIAAVVANLRAHAKQLGMPILESHEPSLARWFASWDGVHYTFAARVAEYPQPLFRWQWQGGVSHMNAVVLLNLLCNRQWPTRSRGPS